MTGLGCDHEDSWSLSQQDRISVKVVNLFELLARKVLRLVLDVPGSGGARCL